MKGPIETTRPAIVVVGGGPSALEAILTLHDRFGDRSALISLVAPDESFVYRPLSTVTPFAMGEARTLSIADLAGSLGARWIRDRVALVDEQAGQAVTHDGDSIAFDYLLLALGARDQPAPPDRLVWGREGDPQLLRKLVGEIASGAVREVGVVVPDDTAWPIAGYELALILAWAAKRQPAETRIWLITEQPDPLAPLGAVACAAVSAELGRVGVRLVAGASVEEGPARQDDAVSTEALVNGEPMRFDRLVTLPISRGPGIAGLAHDSGQYLEVDDHGRVLGTQRVWAAGDCTSSAWKHSTLAVDQADAATDALVAASGVELETPPFHPVLRGILVPGGAESWWAENMSRADADSAATHCLWWPPGKVVGRRLARLIAARDPATRSGLFWHPHGIPINAPLDSTGTRGQQPGSQAGAPSTIDTRARLADTRDRALFAMRNLERSGRATLDQLERRLDQRRAYEETIRRLDQAGYLHHHSPRRRPPG